MLGWHFINSAQILFKYFAAWVVKYSFSVPCVPATTDCLMALADLIAPYRILSFVKVYSPLFQTLLCNTFNFDKLLKTSQASLLSPSVSDKTGQGLFISNKGKIWLLPAFQEVLERVFFWGSQDFDATFPMITRWTRMCGCWRLPRGC